MSNQEGTRENNIETKHPIGSSKRKRKSSTIKHNVINNDKSGMNDNGNSPKPIRTYIKKMKAERGRAGKDKSNNEMTDSVRNSSSFDETKKTVRISSNICTLDENSIVNNETITCENEEDSDTNTNEQTVIPKQKGKTKGTSNSQTEINQCSEKLQCQNCNFCAEHKSTNIDKELKQLEHGTKMFTCKICAGVGLKRVYGSLEKFKRHTKEFHEPKKETKRFECTDCAEPVWFTTKSKFCYHLGAKHPGIIKFICEVCTQTFKLKANYKNHMKTHNIVVQKKFSCDVCGGTFVNRAGYEAHKKRFPGPHIKQSCTHCGISFSREKHMKNHRCKILLLEEAAAARDNNKNAETAGKGDKPNEQEQLEEEIKVRSEVKQQELIINERKPTREVSSEMEQDLLSKQQPVEGDPQAGKRVLFHRLLPKKNEKLIYRQFPLQTQNVPQSVVVQEFREVDLEGGTFIAAEPDHQIILRDVNGHLVQGNQILQLDINDIQPGEESQVYLADWNVVAPFVIRGKSP